RARRSFLASWRYDVGGSLGTGPVPVDVEAGVAGLAELHGADLPPRFEAALDGVHGVAVGLPQRPARCDAPGDRRDAGSEDAVLVLEVVDLEVLVPLHRRNDSGDADTVKPTAGASGVSVVVVRLLEPRQGRKTVA